MRQTARLILAALVTAALLAFAVTVLWYQDWRYSLPTPVPAGMRQPPLGTLMDAAAEVRRDPGRPVLLHFFNPGCPRSRFNLGHIRELIRNYAGRVNVVAVLEEDSTEALDRNFKRLGLGIEAVVDANGAIAAAFGVYSTPQAVVLDSRGSLIYRGNYNSSRYCANRDSEYARIALDAVLARIPAPKSPEALLAHGCPLPKRKEK